jgi:hypothetical protein
MAAKKKVIRKLPASTPQKKAIQKKQVPIIARRETADGTRPVSKPGPTVNVAKPTSTPAPVTATEESTAFEVIGTNNKALFTLKLYRGEGMILLAMNWANGKPPDNFVGFAIEYQEPGGTQFFALKNRLSFLENDGNVNKNILSSRLSPIQKFRWTHFPFHTNLPGEYIYRVTPAFMDAGGSLSYGDFQQAVIQLQSETYPGKLNIGFTRGFVASQAFVDNFGTNGGVGTIIPVSSDNGLDFKPTDPNATKALDWMGFEARAMIINALDQAIVDTTAQVRVSAYDLNVPEIIDRLVKLGDRLRIIIDDSGTHAEVNSCESRAAAMFVTSAGAGNVQRQHMGDLQHNKTIAIMGDHVNLAIGGSTNFSWRGLFVQNNNAFLIQGQRAAQLFFDQFDNMWHNIDAPNGFGATASAGWSDLNLGDIKAKITYSPHIASNAVLKSIASDINSTTSSLFYSLAFLYQTKGDVLDAIKKVTSNQNIFVYGISDKSVGGLDVQLPNGNLPIAFPAALMQNIPEPFKQEATGGEGVRLHHKFVVIDFDKPTARVYSGSYNFSIAADTKNGENLIMIQDRKAAISFMVEAVVMFDHYEFRDAIAKSPIKKLFLHGPPKAHGEKPWWDEYYSVPQKAKDRELFA